MVELIGNTAADPVKGSRSRSAEGLLRILVATLFGLFILLAWVGLPFEVPYIGYGLASAFVFQVAVRPRRWEIVGVVLGGAALALFDQLVVHQGSRPDFQISSCIGFLGLVSFLFVGFRAVWAVGPERQQFKLILIPATALTFFSYWLAAALESTRATLPQHLGPLCLLVRWQLGFPAQLCGWTVVSGLSRGASSWTFYVLFSSARDGAGLRSSFTLEEDRAVVYLRDFHGRWAARVFPISHVPGGRSGVSGGFCVSWLPFIALRLARAASAHDPYQRGNPA